MNNTPPFLHAIDAQDLYESWLIQQYFSFETGLALRATDKDTRPRLLAMWEEYQWELKRESCQIPELRQLMALSRPVAKQAPLTAHFDVHADEWLKLYDKACVKVFGGSPNTEEVALAPIKSVPTPQQAKDAENLSAALIAGAVVTSSLTALTAGILPGVFLLAIGLGVASAAGIAKGEGSHHARALFGNAEAMKEERDRFEAFMKRHRADLRSNLLFSKTFLLPLLASQAETAAEQIARVKEQARKGKQVLEDEHFAELAPATQTELRGYQAAFLRRKQKLLKELDAYFDSINRLGEKVQANIAEREKRLALNLYLAEAKEALQSSAEGLTASEEQAYLQSEQQERLSAELDDFIKTGKIRMDLEMDDLNKALAEELKF